MIEFGGRHCSCSFELLKLDGLLRLQIQSVMIEVLRVAPARLHGGPRLLPLQSCLDSRPMTGLRQAHRLSFACRGDLLTCKHTALPWQAFGIVHCSWTCWTRSLQPRRPQRMRHCLLHHSAGTWPWQGSTNADVLEAHIA